MDKQVPVPRREDKAASKLKRILAQAMLFVPGSLSAPARLHVVAPQKMEQGSVAQANSFIRFAFVVDQQREVDTGFFPEEPSVAHVAQSHSCQAGAFFLEFVFGCAQLRDMLAAENSAVVAEKNEHSRSALPQRSQTRGLAIGVWERDPGELAAERFRHAGHSPGGWS